MSDLEVTKNSRWNKKTKSLLSKLPKAAAAAVSHQGVMFASSFLILVSANLLTSNLTHMHASTLWTYQNKDLIRTHQMHRY